jgi:hypothetical protein
LQPEAIVTHRFTSPRTALPAAGFALLDVMFAVVLLSMAAAGVARLAALVPSAHLLAREQTRSAILAAQKMEQLRALAWGPVEDRTTDLSADPPQAGGTGLAASPDDALEADTAGFVDYADAAGAWIGSGPGPPPGTTYVRRWAIRRLALDPERLLVFQVVVTTLRREARRSSTARGRLPGDVWLIGLETRRPAP